MSIFLSKIKFGRWLIQSSLIIAGVAVLYTLYIMISQVVLYQRYQAMIDSMEKIRQHEYSDSYECLDFSKDLYSELDRYGLKSSIDIVQADTSKSEYHAVVSFQVDPQSGKLVDYKKIDSCRFIDGQISCDKGLIEGRNSYIASNNK